MIGGYPLGQSAVGGQQTAAIGGSTAPTTAALWTPGNLAIPPALWFDAQTASTTTTDASNQVTEWRSRVGGFKAKPYPGNYGSTFSPTGFNGSYPGIVHDQTKFNYLFCSSVTGLPVGNTSSTILAVAGITPAKFNNPEFFGYGQGAQYRLVIGQGQTSHMVATTGHIGDTGVDSSTGTVLVGVFRDAQTNVNYTNGGPAYTTAGGQEVPVCADAYIGCGWGFSGEYLVLAYEPTLADQQKLEGYAAWRWGEQAKLPVNHPYKSAAPTVAATTSPRTYTLMASTSTLTATNSPATILITSRRLSTTLATINLTAGAVGMPVARRVSASFATINVTDKQAAFTTTRRLAILPASVALQGKTVLLSRGIKLNATPASIVIAASLARLLAIRALQGATSTLTLTSYPVSLTTKSNRSFTTSSSAIIANVAPAKLTVTRRLVVPSSALTLAAAPARLALVRRISATTTSVTLTSSSVGLRVTRVARATTAGLTATSLATRLLATRRLTAAPVAFGVTASRAALLLNRCLKATPTSIAPTINPVGFTFTKLSRRVPVAGRTLTLTNTGSRSLTLLTTGSGAFVAPPAVVSPTSPSGSSALSADFADAGNSALLAFL